MRCHIEKTTSDLGDGLGLETRTVVLSREGIVGVNYPFVAGMGEPAPFMADFDRVTDFLTFSVNLTSWARNQILPGILAETSPDHYHFISRDPQINHLGLYASLLEAVPEADLQHLRGGLNAGVQTLRVGPRPGRPETTPYIYALVRTDDVLSVEQPFGRLSVLDWLRMRHPGGEVIEY